MRHPLKVAGIIAVAVTTLAVGVGTAAAQPSTSSGEYSVSSATVSQSMVQGSSPTSLGDSPLAKTPAGRAAAATTAADTGEYTVSTADVQYRTSAGKVLGTRHYGAASMGKRLPAYPATGTRLAKTLVTSAHSGGTSSASGCVRVTVTQTRKGSFGEVLWKFHVWTDWCWTRSNQVVDVNSKNWYVDHIDSQHQWIGIVSSQLNYYDFSVNDGHPHSAYYHWREGHFTNCVLKYGCLGDYYPINYLRSYYNGTWVWDTSL